MKAAVTVLGTILVSLAAASLADLLPRASGTEPAPVARESGRLQIAVPAGALPGRYWVYVDAALVSAPPYESGPCCKAVKTPSGTDVYGKGGLVARFDDDGKSLYVNVPLAREYHLYRSLELALPTGTHTVELVTPGDGYDSGFPFSIRGGSAYVRAGRTTKYAPPVDLAILAVHAGAPLGEAVDIDAHGKISYSGRACFHGSAPDVAEAAGTMRWYLDIPLVKALHSAMVPYLSRERKVVRVQLPVELGGSRELEQSQVHEIVEILKTMVNERLPSSAEIRRCRIQFPSFERSYAKYAELSDRIYGDVASLEKVESSLRSSPQTSQ